MDIRERECTEVSEEFRIFFHVTQMSQKIEREKRAHRPGMSGSEFLGFL
jgi:hypothetical protein